MACATSSRRSPPRSRAAPLRSYCCFRRGNVRHAAKVDVIEKAACAPRLRLIAAWVRREGVERLRCDGQRRSENESCHAVKGSNHARHRRGDAIVEHDRTKIE